MFERLANMYEEKKWEPQSFIRVHPNELLRGFRIIMPIAALFTGFIWYEAAPSLDPWFRLTLATCGAIPVIVYAELRMKKNRRGWYLYEHEGKIIWYTGWASERRLEIEEIAAIDYTGLARLKNRTKVKMPDPDETWYPFYLHLYKNYPALFEKKPVSYNPR